MLWNSFKFLMGKILFHLMWLQIEPKVIIVKQPLINFGFYFIYLFFFGAFRAAPEAHGSSQARGGMGAVAAGLHHSQSKLYL